MPTPLTPTEYGFVFVAAAITLLLCWCLCRCKKGDKKLYLELVDGPNSVFPTPVSSRSASPNGFDQIPL